MTDKIEIVDGARDYRLMTRQVVNAIISLKNIQDSLKDYLALLVLKLNG